MSPSAAGARATRSPWRSLIGPGIVVLVGVAFLMSLGLWQMERLGWKQDLLAKVEARIHQPATSTPDETDWGKIDFEHDEYRHVQATGAFRHDLEVQAYALIDSEPNGGGGPGYWVITPLVMADGATILVNRGFVPLDKRSPTTRPQGQVDGLVTVTGLLRTPEQAGMFTPANDAAKDTWFNRDPAAIGTAKGLLRVAPFLIDADSTPNEGGLPLGGQTRITFPNRHLEYALTWFGLAGTLLVFFLAYAWTRLRRNPAP